MTKHDQRPAVSIVIPTYNHAPLLKKALDSVVAQTFANWEAIVINNYSEDNTVDVVNSCNDSRIQLVNFHNHGNIAASRNQGIRLANADLVAFLDSDDLWFPAKLQRCVEEFTKDIGLVCHGERYERDGSFWKNAVYGCGNKDIYEHLLYEGNVLSPSATVVRREHLMQVGGFSEDPSLITAEDYELWLKLAKAGICFHFIDDILGVYRLHAGNASKSIYRQMNATFAVVNKFFPSVDEATILNRLRIRRRRALIYVSFARAFQVEGHKAEALRHFWKSLSEFPFSLKLYASLGLFFRSLFTNS